MSWYHHIIGAHRGALTFIDSRAVLTILVATVLLVIGLLSARPPDAAAGTFGDASCDGETNSLDAAYILQFEASLIPSVPCPDRADVSLDGELTSADALLILQFDAGLFPHFVSAGPWPLAGTRLRTGGSRES